MQLKTNRERTLMFGVLMLGMIITSMTTTAISNALPVIMADMQITAGTAQWLTSAFTLAAGIMVPATAFLIRRYPNKKLFLAAMSAYAAGSLLAAVAPNFALLLIARIIQGCGCGILMSFVQVVLLSVYPKEKHGSIMGIYGLGCTVAPVVAPTVMGVVIDNLGWHAMFLVFAVLALVDIVLAFPFMKNVTETEKLSFDMPSMILSSIGFCGILIGIGNLSSYSLLHPLTGLPILVGVISLVLFARKQLVGEKPLVDIRVFGHKAFTVAVILNILLYFVSMGNATLLPIFMQNLRGLSATTYALVTLPGSIATAVVTLLAGRLYDKFGGRSLFNGGMIVLALGCAIRSFCTEETSLFNMGLSFFLICCGSGAIMMPATTMGLSELSAAERVHGSAIITTLRQIAGAIGPALGVAIMSIGASVLPATDTATADMRGISVAYMCMAVISIVGFLVAFFNVKPNVRQEAE